MAKISFDFDSTLSQPVIQKLAKLYISLEHEVWIVTSRMSRPEWNFDLRQVAKDLSIPPERIHFTEGDYKHKFLDANNFDFHFDDDYMEIKTAQIHSCRCHFIPIFDPFDIIDTIDG